MLRKQPEALMTDNTSLCATARGYQQPYGERKSPVHTSQTNGVGYKITNRPQKGNTAFGTSQERDTLTVTD